jgi:signal peptidase II
MARRAMGWLLMMLTLALVGCDHATKAVAQATLERRGPLPIVRGVLDLRYTENRDTAFSLLRGVQFPGKTAVLVAFAVVALGAVAVAWWRRRHAPAADQAAYALILAGALGNVLDRARRGFVVDWIEIHRWPVFNVADVAIVAGALLLLFAMLRRARTAEAPPGGGAR